VEHASVAVEPVAGTAAVGSRGWHPAAATDPAGSRAGTAGSARPRPTATRPTATRPAAGPAAASCAAARGGALGAPHRSGPGARRGLPLRPVAGRAGATRYRRAADTGARDAHRTGLQPTATGAPHAAGIGQSLVGSWRGGRTVAARHAGTAHLVGTGDRAGSAARRPDAGR